MQDDPAQVYAALDALGMVYQRYDHPAVFTSEEAAQHWGGIAARGMKNLFLRNKKGNRHYLVILPIEKEADLRRLAQVIGDDRLSFGSPERLAEHLGLTPGSVSPFGLLNNRTHSVQVVVDASIRGAGRLLFHPNRNTHSVSIAAEDLARFLSSTGHAVRWMEL